MEHDRELAGRLRDRLVRAIAELSDLGLSQSRIADVGRRAWTTIWRQAYKDGPVDQNLVDRLETAAEEYRSSRSRRRRLPPPAATQRSVRLQKIGIVCAGRTVAPAEATMRGEGEPVDVPAAIAPDGPACVVQMAGESMSPTIADGDLVVLDLTATPRAGDLVCLTVVGEGTVIRRLHDAGGALEAHAEDGSEPARDLDASAILHGVAVASWRSLRQ